MRPSSRFARSTLPSLAIAIAALGTAAGLAWSVWRCVHAELGAVEIGNWYEASRLRRGLQAFVDPMVGVRDDGPVPIVSLQTYTPFFGYALSRLPEGWTTLVGRFVSVVAWFGGMLGFALTGKPGQRRGALFYALSFLPLFFLLRTAAALAADATATCFACAGLALVLRRGRVTHAAALSMLCGGLLKPNVIGVFLGVLACDMSRKEGRAYRPWLSSAIAGAATLGALQWASHGVWFSAFRMTTQNAFSMYRYWHYLCEYSVFLGAPQLAVALLASRAARSSALPRYGTWALVASVSWQFIASGRYGATTNYWLEPVMAACVVIAHGPRISIPAWAAWASPLGPLILVGVSVVPAWHATTPRDAVADDRQLARIARSCENDGTRSWFGIDPLELHATGRVAAYSFGYVFMARKDPRALEPMRRLLNDPAVSCFLHDRDVAAPLDLTDPGTEKPLYDFYLRDTILAAYDLVDQDEGVYVYRHRRTPGE